MSPLITVPEHIPPERLMRPRALYTGPRKEYVSAHRPT
jgi:citrate synthase